MEDFETTIPVEGEALPSAKISSSGSGKENDASTSSARTEDEPFGALPLDDYPINSSTGPGQAEESDEEHHEEIERDGKKATIPLWLKPELMMHADYTRKTQELAEARRAMEAERGAVQQLSQAELSAYANLQLIDRQIDRFSKTDWNASFDSDAAAAQKTFFQFQLLKDARQETLSYIGQLRSERVSSEQEKAAKRLEECNAELAKHFSDWSPTAAAKLKQQGMQHFRFSAAELDEIDDPRIIVALDAAVQWRDHEVKKKKAQAIQQQQAVRPAAKPASMTAPQAGLDDRLSAEEWLRRRNSQLPKRESFLR